MKRKIPFVPSPIALLSAGLLYGLLVALGAVAAVLVPQLLELLRTNPRLAMMGFLGLVVSPGFVIMLVHHFGHKRLDAVDATTTKKRRRGIFPSTESCWAGAHAWLVLYGTSVLTSLVMLIINPPEPEPDLDSFSTAMATVSTALSHYTNGVAHIASLHTVIWVMIAAQLYELERRARNARHE